jgi:PA14 domain
LRRCHQHRHRVDAGAAGSTRREPEEQELNALTAHKSANPYVRAANSSKWTGYYTPAEAGKFAIFVQTDGKYRLLVDDSVVFDSYVVPKYILNQTTMDLTNAPHKVVLEQLSQQIGSVSGMRVGITPLSTIVEKDALEMASKADAVVLAAAPSGDHTGYSSMPGSNVRRARDFVAGWVTQISELLPSLRVNATRWPSGEIRGV